MNSQHSAGKSFFRANMLEDNEAETVQIPEHEDIIMKLPNGASIDRLVERDGLEFRQLPSSGFR